MKMILTVRDVFTECQKNIQSHRKLVQSLCKIYGKTSFNEFWDAFFHHMKYCLVVFTREPVVERMVNFIVQFATSLSFASRERRKLENEANNEEQQDEMDPFLLKLFKFLLKHHEANDKAVRFRCCQIISKLLASLGDDYELDEDLYDEIFEVMLTRIRDKLPPVRTQAVLALTRLQDPQNKQCRVISSYMFLLGCDPSSDVRRAVLSAIAATTKTLPCILERTKDVKDTVRKLAYQVIADKIDIRALTIAQRVSLIKDGLNDRSDVVKEACISCLMQKWLSQFQGNILELLKHLDVENTVESCDQMLRAFFEKSPVQELVDNFDILNQELTIPLEDLTCESVLYWRSLCSFVKTAGVEAEEYLDKILPTGRVLAAYIHLISEHMKGETDLEAKLQNDFIMQQILEVATLLDFSDEVGRKEIGCVMKSLLVSEFVSCILVKPIVSVFSFIYTEPEQRITALAEIISDIREPVSPEDDIRRVELLRQTELKIAAIRVEVNQMREELDKCVEMQKFAEAAEIKEKLIECEKQRAMLLEQRASVSDFEVRVEKNDPATIVKCLTVVSDALEAIEHTKLSPVLQTLMEVLILPGVTNKEPGVRNAALRALGLCCLLSQNTAKTYLLLFMQVVQIDQEAVKLTALKVVFDLLHMFGLETFEVNAISDEETLVDEDKSPDFDDSDDSCESPQSNGTADNNKLKTASSILHILFKLLDSESSDIRTICAEGLVKLMLSGRIVSSKVMSRLILLWYNPVTEDDDHLRHCLGVFFPVYAFAGRANMDVIEEAFLPTLNTLFNAPTTSPLSKVDVQNTAELLTQLTCVRHLVNKQSADDLQENAPHDNLAVRVCNEILADPNSFGLPVLCRVLCLLELTEGNVSLLKDIQVLVGRMLKEVKDRRCVRMLERFLKTTNDMLSESLYSHNKTSQNNQSSLEDTTQNMDDDLSKEQTDGSYNKDDSKIEDRVFDETNRNTLDCASSQQALNVSTGITPKNYTQSSVTTDERQEQDVAAELSHSTVSIQSSTHATDHTPRQSHSKKQATKPASVCAKRGTGRSTRSMRQTRQSSVNMTDESLVETSCKKLDSCLSESDSDPHDEEEAGETGKRRCTRSHARRGPLCDIDNEVN